MSFDHWLLTRPQGARRSAYPIGLTAEGAEPEDFFVHEQAMALGLDFISYHITASAQRLHYIASAARPVSPSSPGPCARHSRRIATTHADADQMTFEGFDPREQLVPDNG